MKLLYFKLLCINVRVVAKFRILQTFLLLRMVCIQCYVFFFILDILKVCRGHFLLINTSVRLLHNSSYARRFSYEHCDTVRLERNAGRIASVIHR